MVERVVQVEVVTVEMHQPHKTQQMVMLVHRIQVEVAVVALINAVAVGVARESL
jgi:hypothetical protein